MTGRSRFSTAWRAFRAGTDLDEYETRWDRLAAEGHDVHGEADLVASYGPSSVLDAGCGMGRVAIELWRRGLDVVGVDLDPDLLERARRRAPTVPWVEGDLSGLDLQRTFDLVVMAGNVIPFVEPADRQGVVEACARHLVPGGRLVIGATLDATWPTVDDYDRWSTPAGLALAERFAGWAREPWTPEGGHHYAVSVYVLSSASSSR
jgi:SAM-dependent methyltransferase